MNSSQFSNFSIFPLWRYATSNIQPLTWPYFNFNGVKSFMKLHANSYYIHKYMFCWQWLNSDKVGYNEFKKSDVLSEIVEVKQKCQMWRFHKEFVPIVFEKNRCCFWPMSKLGSHCHFSPGSINRDKVLSNLAGFKPRF